MHHRTAHLTFVLTEVLTKGPMLQLQSLNTCGSILAITHLLRHHRPQITELLGVQSVHGSSVGDQTDSLALAGQLSVASAPFPRPLLIVLFSLLLCLGATLGCAQGLLCLLSGITAGSTQGAIRGTRVEPELVVELIWWPE